MAIPAVSANRDTSSEPNPKAAAVLASTIGLTTGAASRKATPTETGRPFLKSRRVSGTVPHSQTGKSKPSAAPASAPPNAPEGIRRRSRSGETNTSTSPDAMVPNSKNGTASMKMPRKTVENVES
jgi:hypothetical protein